MQNKNMTKYEVFAFSKGETHIIKLLQRNFVGHFGGLIQLKL